MWNLKALLSKEEFWDFGSIIDHYTHYTISSSFTHPSGHSQQLPSIGHILGVGIQTFDPSG